MENTSPYIDRSNALGLGKKSWVAYAYTLIMGSLLLLIGLPLAAAFSTMAMVVMFIACALFITYHVLMLKSQRLFCDETGVWICSGFLPWQRGVRGVKWQDFGEAVYESTFSSWLFKSYKIRVVNRFTQADEIQINHWTQGDRSVHQINSQHRAWLSSLGVKSVR